MLFNEYCQLTAKCKSGFSCSWSTVENLNGDQVYLYEHHHIRDKFWKLSNWHSSQNYVKTALAVAEFSRILKFGMEKLEQIEALFLGTNEPYELKQEYKQYSFQ